MPESLADSHKSSYCQNKSGIVPVGIHIIDGVGLRLDLRTNNGTVAQQMVAGGDVMLSFDIAVRDSLYIRAELRDTKTGNCTALTNPIYVNQKSRDADDNSTRLA